jgi:hypothetical protein
LTRATFFKRLALLDTQRRHFAIYLLIAEPTRRPGADENVSRLSGSRVESLGVFAASSLLKNLAKLFSLLLAEFAVCL